MANDVIVNVKEAADLATRACLAAGADGPSARSLVEATLSAALHGPATLGFPHFVDYLNGFIEGRINARPSPRLLRQFPAFLASDADGGIAQLGFDLAFEDLLAAVRTFGVAVFTQSNSFTTGELGYYVRRLALEGIVALAATNANPMVVSKPGGPAVYSTNPMAFGFPLGTGSPPMVIDQASSATALVNVVRAAEEGEAIPEGWAVDADGHPTTDATKALAGALLPFGGRKGGNVALMVEMLSAGLSGGRWSLDVPDFRSGAAAPQVGMTLVAMMPGKDSEATINRAAGQAARLQAHDVFVPGVSGAEPEGAKTSLAIPRSVFERISAIAIR